MINVRNGKMVVVNRTGAYEYPYTKLGNKRIYYYTRAYTTNGARERTRRIKQMLKGNKNGSTNSA